MCVLKIAMKNEAKKRFLFGDVVCGTYATSTAFYKFSRRVNRLIWLGTDRDSGGSNCLETDSTFISFEYTVDFSRMLLFF